jgi:peptidoglycan/LPS O-acetylase OafA/YrhL
LSGYLSFRKAVPAPWVWFGAKLKQIFPAYWIVTLGSFALVIFFGTKEASWPLFVSQMLGMGYFTHGWKLVNVVSWFISLILLCYLLAAVAWASGQPRWVLAIISGVCIGLLVQSVEVDLSRHVLAFALAGWIAITRARTGVIVVIAGIGLYSAGMLDMQLAYASIALALLAAGLCIPMQERPYVKAASARTYEFFLVHGVFLVAFAQLLPISPVANVTLALIAAVVAALLLRVTVVRLTCLFAARFPRARAEPY